MPEVTVVIPTYNRERFVGRAIRSALAQTYSDIEVVVVDDGSTDDTQIQVESLAQADVRVRYLRHETNRGAQAARNTGIRAARGKYVALLDSDDEWLPEKLELQMSLFSQGGDHLGVVYASYWRVPSDGAPSIEHLATFRGDVYRTALAQWIADTDTLVIRKDILEQAGLCDESIRAYQEWDLCIRLARYAEFDFVPQPLAIYHIHSSPTISKNLLLSAWGYLDVVEAHRDEILRECGAATLSRHYISAGQQFILADRFDLARQSFLQAVRVTPVYPKALLHISVALLGRRGYEVLRSIKRRVRSLNPGSSSNSPSTHLISGV